jgi:hypothetical protein
MASARPASQGSGSEQETPDGQSHFVIPSPIDDCGDVPSPSQHRLSRASQFRQAGVDGMSDDQDQDDGSFSEEADEDGGGSNSSGGEDQEEEEEEEQECESSDEKEQDGDASEAESSRAPSKQPSSHNQLEVLVRNLQTQVAYLQAQSQALPVDVLSVRNSNKRRRLRSPDVVEDEEASGFVESLVSDHGYQSDSVWDSAHVRTPRKRNQPKYRFVAARYTGRTTPDEIKAWLTTTANESMALTGQYSNVLSKPEDMGPFKKAHVRFLIIVSLSSCFVLCFLTCYVCFFVRFTTRWVGLLEQITIVLKDGCATVS